MWSELTRTSLLTGSRWPRLLFALCMISSPTSAEPGLGVSLKGGGNAATSAEDYRDNRYGLTGGLAGYYELSIGSRFSLAGQAELLYTPRGAKVIKDGRYLGRSRLHYLDFAVAARPGVRFGVMNAYLILGAELDLLMNASKEDAGMEVDITADLHRIDVALLVGAGLALRLPHQRLGPV